MYRGVGKGGDIGSCPPAVLRNEPLHFKNNDRYCNLFAIHAHTHAHTRAHTHTHSHTHTHKHTQMMICASNLVTFQRTQSCFM